MKNYEINVETLAIFPYENNKSKIIELNREFVVDCLPIKIINNSCKFFGSTYKGRINGTKNMLGSNHKLPIIIEESKKIIFFPTKSPRLLNCEWISFNNIVSYDTSENGTIIKFYGGKNINISVSYWSLNNQILRSSRLESILSKRVNYINKIY